LKNPPYQKTCRTSGFQITWDNTMLFLEVDDVARYWKELQSLGLEQRFKNVKLTSIREENWGRECFMHDPSGVLWHFGEFR